jgi:hypothetical protein
VKYSIATQELEVELPLKRQIYFVLAARIVRPRTMSCRRDAKVRLVNEGRGVVLGSRWSYAMSATIPFLDSKVTANVNAAVGPFARSISRTSEVTCLGDIVLMPLIVILHRSRTPRGSNSTR